MNRAHYCECHITIEPVFDLDRFVILTELAEEESFRVAKLVMIKTEEDNRKDSFMTGRHMDVNVLYERMVRMIKALKENGFTVYRYKIERTLLDSKHYDICKLLESTMTDTSTESQQLNREIYIAQMEYLKNKKQMVPGKTKPSQGTWAKLRLSIKKKVNTIIDLFFH